LLSRHTSSYVRLSCQLLSSQTRTIAYYGPIFAMPKEYKLKSVSKLSLKPGEKQEVEVEGIEDGKVLLVNAGGSIQALGSKCTHYGAPLVTVVLTASGRLPCPWHGGKSPLRNYLPYFLLYPKSFQGLEARKAHSCMTV